jgi:hypothetical protein
VGWFGKSALLVIGGLALSSCVLGGSAKPSSTRTPTPSANATSGLPVVSPATAWPGAHILTIDPHLPGGRMFGEVAALPDGKIFGFTFTPSNSVPEGGVEPRGDIVFLDLATLAIQKVASFLGSTSQVLYADGDTRWIVWSEASHQPDFPDWTLRLLDRTSGQIRVLASAAVAGGYPVPGPQVAPRTDHDLVVWSAGVNRATLGTHSDCFVASATGGPPQTLATDCVNPVIAWPRVLYDQHFGPESGGYVALTAMDLRTRQLIPLPVSIRNSKYYALAGTAFLYTTEDNRTIHLADLSSGNDQTLLDVTASDTGYIEFPALSDRLATWAETRGGWAYDRAQRKLVQLSVSSNFGFVYLRDRNLIWSDHRDPNSQSRDDRFLRAVDFATIR